MALASGTKLGPYEIQSPLGAGGMGEVYRAKDARLDRTVAIKVLPSHLSADPELKLRMEREAKAISALQHANICTLYDIGTQDGTNFLVMEYLEGQTLAERLAKGAVPLDQVLKIGTEIAQALEKAHLQGIIHRDLIYSFDADHESGFAHLGCVAAYSKGLDRGNVSVHGARGLARSGSRCAQRPLQFWMRSVRNDHRPPRFRRKVATQRIHCHSGKRSGVDHCQPAASPAHARSRGPRLPRQGSGGPFSIRA